MRVNNTKQVICKYDGNDKNTSSLNCFIVLQIKIEIEFKRLPLYCSDATTVIIVVRCFTALL